MKLTESQLKQIVQNFITESGMMGRFDEETIIPIIKQIEDIYWDVLRDTNDRQFAIGAVLDPVLDAIRELKQVDHEAARWAVPYR